MAKGTVLVIEDNEMNMKLIKTVLRIKGNYKVFEATTAENGIEMARKYQPDIILMDIQLPGMDGYEATRRIKANPNLRHIPIIVVTSYALSGDDVKAFEAGGDGYVSKPFSPRELLAKIREYLP